MVSAYLQHLFNKSTYIPMVELTLTNTAIIAVKQFDSVSNFLTVRHIWQQW